MSPGGRLERMQKPSMGRDRGWGDVAHVETKSAAPRMGRPPAWRGRLRRVRMRRCPAEVVNRRRHHPSRSPVVAALPVWDKDAPGHAHVA
eukprot:9818923-Alexandrium_andersonii.AAC.1